MVLQIIVNARLRAIPVILLSTPGIHILFTLEWRDHPPDGVQAGGYDERRYAPAAKYRRMQRNQGT